MNCRDRPLNDIKASFLFFQSDLPFILLLNAESGEAEVTANRICPHEVNLPVYSNKIDEKQILAYQKDI